MFNLKGFKENSMKLMTLRQDLIKAVKKKSMRLAEASQQQQYNRGNEDLELWLSEVEGQLLPEDYNKDLTSEQNLQKKHALLKADVGAHQDKSMEVEFHWNNLSMLVILMLKITKPNMNLLLFAMAT